MLCVSASAFACCALQDLFESLQSNLRAGLPGFHKGSYKVRENKFFHIPSSGDEVGNG